LLPSIDLLRKNKKGVRSFGASSPAKSRAVVLYPQILRILLWHPDYRELMLALEIMRTAIPISKYVPKKFGKIELKGLRVFKLDGTPKSCPIDLNVAALSGEGWSLSDRLRFWHTLNGKSLLPGTRLTVRKLELDDQALVHWCIVMSRQMGSSRF
jgi:hypothetical protein